MPQHLGDYPVSGKVALLWNTNDQTGASITRSTDGTLKIFKAHATASTWATERTSLAGVTQLEDFDATGMHSVYIDLSDNTDVGFYAAGNEYQVAIVGAVVDTKTVNVVLGAFSIERSGGALALIKAIIAGTSLATVDVAKWLGTTVATPTVAGVPAVDLTHLGGVAQSATDLKDFADDGYDPVTNKVQGVVLTDTLTTYTGNTPQTGDVFPLASTEIADIKTDTAAILLDTAEIGTAGAGLTAVGITQAAADKVFGASGAALPELAQAIPSATPSPRAAMMLLYMALRNLDQVTATEKRITNDAGVVIVKKALSDDGTTYAEAEMVSGP